MTPQFLMKPILQRVFYLLLVLTSIQFIQAKLSYSVWTVDTSNATHEPIVSDVNGDGLKDLVVPQYFPSRGRELYVYLQEANGSRFATPLIIEIKSETIGFALADVRETAGTEILWITANAVYSFSANISGYANNLEHLLDWVLFVRHPDSKELLYLETIDVNRDTVPDLILPGASRYGIFLTKLQEGLELVATINLPESSEQVEISNREFNRSLTNRASVQFDEQGRFNLTTTWIPRSQYHNLFTEINREEKHTRSITYGEWQTGLIAHDLNGDGFMDLMFQSEHGITVGHLHSEMTKVENERLHTGTSEVTASDASNLMQYELPNFKHYGSSFEDIDGDGDLDVVVIDSGITSSTVHLILNENGEFNTDEPTQVLRISGTIVSVEFSPLQPSDTPLMLINTITVPLRKMLSEIELHRNLLLFERNDGKKGIFARKPSLTSTTSINIDSLRNLMPSTMKYDLDRDGLNDVVGCNSDGAVQAHRIDASPRIEPEAFWQFVPEYAVFSATSDYLNNDDLPDLILEHSTSMTYLMSRQ